MDKIIIEPVILTKQNDIRQYGFRFVYTLYAQQQELFQYGMEYPYVSEPDNLVFLQEAVKFIKEENVHCHIELALYFFFMDSSPDAIIQVGDRDYCWSDVCDYLAPLFSE